MAFELPISGAFLAIVIVAGVTGNLHGAETGAPGDPKEDAVVPESAVGADEFEEFTIFPRLYKRHHFENPFIQELGLTGVYHGQYHHLDSNAGSDDDWENRRLRAGAKARFFNFLDTTVTFNFDKDARFSDAELDVLLLTAKFHEAFEVSLGKFKPHWSHEWSTSSKRMLTFERSLLVNQLRPDKSFGISGSGTAGKWSYGLGVWNADLENDDGEEQKAPFIVATSQHDFGESVRMDRAEWRMDAIWRDDPDELFVPYTIGLATSLAMAKGPWGFAIEGLYGEGEADAWGVNLMPVYSINERLQVVGRYQFAHGQQDSLFPQSRYEAKAPNLPSEASGGRYNAAYLGLNYLITGHQLKVMAGVEYSDLQNRDGDGKDLSSWTWLTGIRLYF